MWKTEDPDTKKILYVQTNGEKTRNGPRLHSFSPRLAQPWTMKSVFTLR